MNSIPSIGLGNRGEIKETSISSFNSSNEGEKLKSDLPTSMPEHIKYKVLNWMKIENPTDEMRNKIFNTMIKNLYLNIPTHLLDIDKEIAVMGRVLGDGLGDYYLQLSVINAIRQYYPNLKTRLIATFSSSNESSIERLKNIRMPDCEFNFFSLGGISLHPNFDVDSENSTDSTPVKKVECSKYSTLLEQENSKLLKKTPSIFATIELPGQVYIDNDEIKELRENNYVKFSEYGYKNLGLDPLDEGIIIKDLPKLLKLEDLKDEDLKQILFNTKYPNISEINDYKEKNSIYFCYIKKKICFQQVFIYSLVKSQANNKKRIDILLPLNKIALDWLNLDFLREQGVNQITLYIRTASGIEKIQKKVSDQGKELRIINFSLSPEDTHILMIQELTVGCTGDQSFSETISFNRIPFYEILDHKEMFFMQFRKLVEKELPNSQLKDYLNLLKNLPRVEINEVTEEMLNQTLIGSEKMAVYFSSSQLQLEINQISEIIRKNFSFQQSIKEIVARQLAHEKYPELADYENKLLYEDFYNEKNISLIWTEMQQKILEICSN
jgi:hypothetical protein